MVKQTNSRQANRVVTGMMPSEFDRVRVTYPDSITEVYTFLLDGNSVGIITIIYTDATKRDLDDIVRSN